MAGLLGHDWADTVRAQTHRNLTYMYQDCGQRLGKLRQDDRNCWGTVERGSASVPEYRGLTYRHTAAGWRLRRAGQYNRASAGYGPGKVQGHNFRPGECTWDKV